MGLTGTMTWDEVTQVLGIGDRDWNDQVRAVADAFGSGENEPFVDWLINGSVAGSDTIDDIYHDWENND